MPLSELIGEVFEVGAKSKKVEKEYLAMIRNIGNEFYILVNAPEEKIIKNVSDKNIFLAIKNMRAGKVKIIPGFDGQYGVVKTLGAENKKQAQNRLF